MCNSEIFQRTVNLLSDNFPKKYEKQIEEYIAVEQIERLRNVSIISAVALFVIFIVTDLTRWWNGGMEIEPKYQTIAMGRVWGIALFIFIPIVFSFTETLKKAAQELLFYTFLGLSTLWGILMSLIDIQIIPGLVTAFLLMTMVLGTTVPMLSKLRIWWLVATTAVFILCNLVFNSHAHNDSPIVSAMANLIIMLFLSGYIANLRNRQYVAYIELMEGNRRLNEANRELDSSRDEYMRQNQELEALNGELKQIVYILSHDLKEPARTITAFTSLLKKSVHDNQLTDDQLEYLEFIFSGANRFHSLLDDLKRYVAIELPKSTDETSLSQIVDIVKASLRVLIEENKAIVNVTLGANTKLWYPESLMVQMLQNLVANAIKFKREIDPVINISMKLEDEGRFYRIDVEDNGRGIEKAYYQRIFHIFSRVDNNEEGTGIGLAICDRIAKKLGGHFALQSEVGVGTTFSIYLPVI